MRARLLFLAMVLCAAARGQSLDTDILATKETDKKPLHVVLAKDQESDPATKFATDTPKISAYWKGDRLHLGSQIRGVWLAENLGIAGRKETKITEAWVVAYKPDDDGAFALARPKEGWPIGKYRFELYVDGKLAEAIKFVIEEPAPTATP